ncbi:MAG: hypothetical protein JSS81_14245 [Acidobacteria bacterium]|nr:hypothetical protein [Acidobacteriota bacterium]
MIELQNFYNAGFGWVCRRCEAALQKEDGEARARLLREGEAEGKNPRLSQTALARWADADRRTLVCPRCGASEKTE